jgi:L-lactate dehydrogenase complex protein LldG
MTSREKILTNIRNNKPTEQVALPTNINFESNTTDFITLFSNVLKSIGGEAITAIDFDFIGKDIVRSFPDMSIFVNLIPRLSIKDSFAQQKDSHEVKDAHDLALVDLAILEGKIGVAENGAIWLDESCFGGHRVLPFITQHLVIVLKKENIVANMHHAYQMIEMNNIGFGLFLAGPSKTADIEQSLVIGAHGARSLKVYLV